MIYYVSGIIPTDTKKNYVYRYTDYNVNIFTFDIEVSSGYLTPNGNIIPFKKGCQKKYSKYIKVAIPYLWQSSINDTVYYGRQLETFVEYLHELSTKYKGKKIIWVHNLAYEFQFLINVIKWDRVFAKKARKVIYAEFNDFTFRCTYFLTHKSLDNWGKDSKLPVQKLTGTIDYTIIRTPLTTLDQNMLKYGEHDCMTMYYGLLQYVEIYKDVHKIPLTQTGRVREVVKKALKSYKHHKKMTDLLPRNAAEYALLRACYWGGSTNASYYFSNIILYDIDSWDIGSSYPASLALFKYPMSRFEKVESFEPYDNENYSAILDLTFINISSILYVDYLPYSQCYDTVNEVLDNGKIICASKLSIICTNIDFEIIKKCYKYDKIIYNDIQIAINKWLPRPLILTTLNFYSNKTKLKGIDEEYGNYMESKEFNNSIYGMMVSAIVHGNISFDDETWNEQKLTPDDITNLLNDLRGKPYKNFLSYAWGVWITAYSRRNLWTIIIQIHKIIAYYDTDSTKFPKNKKYNKIFEKYNDYILKRQILSSTENLIPLEMYQPVDIDGNKRPIGFFEQEKPYKEFITLGAKRYAYRDNNDKLHITVSGVNKIKGVEALNNDIRNFQEDLIFNEDTCGKLTLTYLSDMPKVTWNKRKYDEFTCDFKFGIHAEPTTYTMSITPEYLFCEDVLTQDNFDEYTASDLHDLVKKYITEKKEREKRFDDFFKVP